MVYMKNEHIIDRILDKVVLILLIVQIGFIMYMNLFHADFIIDYDCSSAYMHEIEMGSQKKIFPTDYSYQSSMDLDGAAIVSAFLYHFTQDIFVARGIANSLVVILYIFIINCVLANLDISLRWKRFGILLFMIPYSMIMLGYWRMLFVGGGFFAFRALVPILIISLILDIEKGNALKKYAFRLLLMLTILFLTGLSSGAYVVMSAVCPLILWEMVSAFLKADYKCLRSKRTVVAVSAVCAALVGIVAQKTYGFSSTADVKYILTSGKWIDALLSSFAGIFELFGGLTIHENVKLFSLEACGTAINFIVAWILIASIIYTLCKCIKKRDISNMNGYILSLMLVNILMFCFLDLKYGETVFESRYHLIPMLPAFFMLVIMLEDCSKSKILHRVQIQTIHVLTIGIFIASMLYGDAQWVYAKTALESDKLVELNRIIEENGVNTAFVIGDDNKVLGRKLRVYSRDTHYIILNDGAKSAWQTTWGGTTRYLDNSMHDGKTAVIASSKAFKTIPEYLVKDMEYLTEYDGLQIYIGDESKFDCVGGIVAGKNKLVDYPYSPDYIYENAKLDNDGFLVMNNGGGTLKSSYPCDDGKWEYIIYYDMPDENGEAFVDISVEEDNQIRVNLNPAENSVCISDIAMKKGKILSFYIEATEGTVIKKIELNRK